MITLLCMLIELGTIFKDGESFFSQVDKEKKEIVKNYVVICFFGASWCPPCQRLHQKVFGKYIQEIDRINKIISPKNIPANTLWRAFLEIFPNVVKDSIKIAINYCEDSQESISSEYVNKNNHQELLKKGKDKIKNHITFNQEKNDMIESIYKKIIKKISLAAVYFNSSQEAERDIFRDQVMEEIGGLSHIPTTVGYITIGRDFSYYTGISISGAVDNNEFFKFLSSVVQKEVYTYLASHEKI